jgi:cytochrome c peroxidase
LAPTSTTEQIDAITAFLGSLTGTVPEIVYPILPPETAATPRPTGEVLP